MSRDDVPNSAWGEFSSFYESNRNALYRYVRSLAKNKQDAEDITQEVFMRLYQQANRRGELENPVAWLNKAAKNLFIDGVRHGKHEDLIDSEDLHELELIVDKRSSPEDLAIQENERSVINAALTSLSSVERRCVMLMSEGWNFRQIANATELTYEVAINQTKVALRKLRSQMTENRIAREHA